MIHTGPATHVLFLDTDTPQFIMIGNIQELATISELLADDKSVIASIGSISSDTWMQWKDESDFVYIDLLKNKARPRTYLRDEAVIMHDGNELATSDFLPDLDIDLHLSIISETLSLQGFKPHRLKYGRSVFRPAYADDPNTHYNRIHQILVEYVQEQSNSPLKLQSS